MTVKLSTVPTNIRTDPVRVLYDVTLFNSNTCFGLRNGQNSGGDWTEFLYFSLKNRHHRSIRWTSVELFQLFQHDDDYIGWISTSASSTECASSRLLHHWSSRQRKKTYAAYAECVFSAAVPPCHLHCLRAGPEWHQGQFHMHNQKGGWFICIKSAYGTCNKYITLSYIEVDEELGGLLLGFGGGGIKNLEDDYCSH